MQIDRIYYPVLTLGYGRRIGLWTVGCPHACPRCSNPELWPDNPSKDVSLRQLQQWIATITQPIDGVTITGGEPFIQAEELAALTGWLRREVTDDILLYTGYTLEALQAMNRPAVEAVLADVAALIDGRYVDEQNDGAALRGSANQRLHILNTRYTARYREAAAGRRTVQNVLYGDRLLTIGIPVRGFRESLRQKLPEQGILSRIEEGEEHGGEPLGEMAPGTGSVPRL
ncbi:4Fe-4S cluster-binding domain-containing protein [Heliobacterium gestii]|uniref:4Fe-4S cluster-binding domain-containing protein n=1 Tax=Heliomicrobium gestii TaxID=2699 RepID=A0A845LAE1_HELGE|nr:4Fe-4S single cluster domain-containing protein [Heliomicrobium gestii]MBM7865650.1 anaerobic ribonucleoside-triphosphate reductase activating protein [Heliomicrobium gestii]MZP41900.1 4Fe-4S cluster-binding domain-containing protein [Heliomicrobium gestii]